MQVTGYYSRPGRNEVLALPACRKETGSAFRTKETGDAEPSPVSCNSLLSYSKSTDFPSFADSRTASIRRSTLRVSGILTRNSSLPSSAFR